MQHAQLAFSAHKMRRCERSVRSVLTPSTARDDAPNADKLNFFEGDSGDRAAFEPFCHG